MLRVLFLLLASTPAFAGEPGALVTEASGDVRPPVELFDEVEIGSELTIGPGARLTLEHYASCEAATVTGGTALVGKSGFDLGRAEVAGRIQTPCARTVTLQAGDVVNAGLVTRGEGTPRVPLAPQIVLAGGGDGHDIMRIERDGREIAALPIRAGRVAWPDGGLFLSDGTAYVLVLAGPAGERRASVVADKDASGRTVLRP